MSLATLLGGRRHERIPAYASTLFRSTPEANFEAARAYVQRGFRAVKFGWGGFGWDRRRDAEWLAAAREGLGDGTELMVDPGWYSVDAATGHMWRSRSANEELCAMVGGVRATWIEDFVNPDCPEEYSLLRRGSTVAFAAGEQATDLGDFRRLIDGGGIDFIQPDLSRCGGITVARQVALLARLANVEVVTHSWLSDLLTAYSLHLLSSLVRAPYLELNVSQSELSCGVCRGQLGVLGPDGCVQVPDGSGIGVAVDEEFVVSHRAT